MSEKLSPAQQEVMKWLSGGWEAHITHGLSVSINGKRVCNYATLEALMKKGLVEQSGQWSYRAIKKETEAESDDN